jgi:hypothetical protein
VSEQYFEVVAIKPFLGRLLQSADDDHPWRNNRYQQMKTPALLRPGKP